MTASKKYTLDLTEGPILKQMLAYLFPVFLSTLVQQLYNSADRMVVGQFSGKLALAAVGSTGYPTNLLLNMVVGLSTGANVIIANFRGAKNEPDTRKAMYSAMSLSLIGGVILLILGTALSGPILRWMNTPEDTIALSTLYMRIIFCGSPFSMIYNFGSSIMRAHGDTKRPMTILIVSGIANVVLNYVFVAFCHMSVAGVALATIIAHAISAGWVLCILLDPKDIYRLNIKELKLHQDTTRLILYTGIPCGLNAALLPFASLFLQSSINSFGSVVLAGSSASDSLTNPLSTGLTAIASTCTSFAGQCFGAKKYKRIRQFVYVALAVSLAMQVTFLLACIFFRTQLLSIFTSDPEVLKYATTKTILVMIAYVGSGCGQVFQNTLRGIRISGITTVMSLFSLCVVRLVWIWFIFPMNPTIEFLYYCFPVSLFCNCILQGITYFVYRKRLLMQEA